MNAARPSAIPSPLRIVFLGTPEFAVPTVRALASSEERLLAVVCQPDRAQGRSRKIEAPPVKRLALDLGIEVLQPEKLSDPAFLARMTDLAPDLLVVAAYGKILRRRMLDLPRLGCINVHASLLPKYRGAAPIQWAIVRGERETGVTIMRMDEGMDTGPILLSRAVPIGPEETAGELAIRLAELGAACLLEAIRALRAGTLRETPQDDTQATPAPLLRREDGCVDWSLPPGSLHDFVRGMHPWPGAFTTLEGKEIKLHRVRPADVPIGEAAAGTVLLSTGRLVVAAGGGAVEVLELQAEGRRRLPAAAFLNGFPVPVGARLGG